MPNFLAKIRTRFTSPSPSASNKSKSTGDLSFTSTQGYAIKEKDLSKLQLAAWKGNLKKVIELSQADKINLPDKEGRFFEEF